MFEPFRVDNILMYEKGGGGSGGGTSGKVDFPDYMKDWHGDALDGGGADTLSSSVTDIINAALGNSPFSGEVAYDPDTDITAYEAAISGFDTILAGISETVDWAALYTQATTSIATVSDAEITADITAFSDELDDEITTKTLPRFEAGMNNINSVVSSAFVIGRSVIEAFKNRDVARHSSKIRIAVVSDRNRLYVEGTSQMMQLMLSKYGWEESYMRTVIEGKRIKIVAKKEESDKNLKIDESDALWDLELFKYGSNVLSSISGSAVSDEVKHNTAGSVLGGALSGVAAGAMMGSMFPGIGTGVGAIAGGLLGAGAAFMQ